MGIPWKWSYGVTTVPDRRGDLLPRTLASLRCAGFEAPRLFVDGDNDPQSWQREFSLEVTCRCPTIRTYGNWVLSMAELYIRVPDATHYALFQDDLVTYHNLKSYLQRVIPSLPEKCYLNLYTFPSNQSICPVDEKGQHRIGFYESNGFGRGAVALVFDRTAVLTLLTHQHMVERPMDAHRGWKAVDGGIVTAMLKAGYKEYVHNPSLVQHTGLKSAMGNLPHKQAISFMGEDFDVMKLLEKRQIDKTGANQCTSDLPTEQGR